MRSLVGMTILQVIEDPSLLGKSYRKRLFQGDSWRARKAFLKALFALLMNADGLALYRKCTGRTTAPTKAFREAFIIAGRRSGKSFIIRAIAVFVAVFMSFAEYLSPGEIPVVAVIASDKVQSLILFRYIRAFLQGSAVLRSMVVSDLKEIITLSNGVEIQVLAGDYCSIRGRTDICCLLDDLAFFASDGSSPDTELLAAIRPSMISIPNSLLLGISSPYSRNGVLYREYQEHYGKDTPDTLIWQSDSLTMNPTLNAKAIESAYAKDPVSAASEYGGHFRDDLESYISRETVEACIVRGVHERAPVKGVEYYGFVDPSGGRSDSFCLGIGHLEGETTVLDFLGERPSPSSPDESVAVYAEILKRYHICEVTGDRYAGTWPEDSFSKHGIVYRASEKGRSSTYVDFLPQLMSRRTRLLDDGRIVSQLTALERRTGKGHETPPQLPRTHRGAMRSTSRARFPLKGTV